MCKSVASRPSVGQQGGPCQGLTADPASVHTATGPFQGQVTDLHNSPFESHIPCLPNPCVCAENGPLRSSADCSLRPETGKPPIHLPAKGHPVDPQLLPQTTTPTAITSPGPSGEEVVLHMSQRRRSVLLDSDAPRSHEPELPPSQPVTNVSTKLPPIYVNDHSKVVDLVSRLRVAVRLTTGTDMSLRGPNTLRISCATYEGTLALLKQNGLQFHTLAGTKLCLARLVLRGLDISVDPQEVVDELRDMEFSIVDAARLYNSLMAFDAPSHY